ncbi:TniB family NTP-binding protein [Ralstonia pseudosolanacearum]|uniref:TniB family NTP-binding protein n=1 Tax=Ralstonia pseudosolanacearum TaxID=1310165 RepID=UPI0026757265|nr:TniB family NTP-binding protein [Ralstonia pseudosolanacearum]MDO3621552.1 TniB family NTP-binding protein [Ralstonia pseudosolanacearum]
MSVDHLTEATAKLLELDDEARIERIRSPRWIGYPRAKEVLAKLEDLLSYPKSHRMPNMLIVGDTNNGKTMLIERFCAQYPADNNPSGDGVIVPVLSIQAPPVPDEGRLYNAILELLFAPYKPNDRVDKKQLQVVKLLRYVGLKMLVIDEIHHVLAGNLNRQRAFLNVLKFLGNELQVPIVAAGTRDAFRALQTDPQLANRFEPVLLPRWELNNDFLRLLASFERMLPLREASNLHDTALASRLFSMSEGYIGELSRVLTKAAVHAVGSGTERVNGKVLDQIEWVSPSDRKRQIDRAI